MKNIFKTVAAFAAVVLAGCTTDFNGENITPEVGTTSVTIGLPESRTTLGELVEGKRKITWNEGDQIVINGETSTAIKINEDNAGIATFDFGAVLNRPYSAFYPAELLKSANTVTLPATQAYKANTFAEDSAPMACYAEEGDALTLHHLAAVIRLQVKVAAEDADLHTINRIEIRGGNSEQMSGDFTLDYAAATLTDGSTADADKVVKATYNKDLGDGVVDFFVVVPAREYANGITVRVIDTAGHYMEKSSPAMALAKGEVKAMPEFEFVPTGTTVDTEIAIASAAEWNTFVAAYNEGAYEGQVVSVNITADLTFDDDTNEAFASIEQFGGQINGGNKAFKNLKATCPIFESVYNAEVKNITIDSSSSFTFENIVFTNALYAAALANNAYYATISGCVNRANVTVSGCTTDDDSPNIHIGGLLARTDANTVVSGCENHGKVETTNTNHTKLVKGIGEMRHGGVVGYCRGEINTCVNEGAIVSAFNCGRKGIGGVVGRGIGTASIINCTNKGAISDSAPRTYQEILDHNRWTHVGGIVGIAAGPITGCTNQGEINTTTDVKILHIGGVLGRVNGNNAVVFSGNNNTGVITHNGASRQTSIGALIGSSDGNKIPELDLTDCTIGGSITAKNLEDHATQTIVKMGAVIGDYGVMDSDIDPLVIKNATISTNVHLTADANNRKYYAGYMGGVVGFARAAKISNCTVNGEVAMTIRSSNSNNATASEQVFHIGGVAGTIISGASSITNCHVTNLVKTWRYNNMPFYNSTDGLVYKSNTLGGILGSFGYVKEYRDSNSNYQPINFDNASFSLTGCTFSGNFVNYRGLGGGIAGYVYKATVSECEVTANLYYDNAHQYNYVGGVVCAAEDTTISDSWCKSTITANSGGSMIGHAGGVAAFLVGNVTVNGCGYYGDVSTLSNTECGGLVAEVVNVAGKSVSLTNCKFGGSVAGNAITADNLATYAVGAGTATVTGTTLWDGTVTE